TGFEHSKLQFLRRLDDTNPHPVLRAFEEDILRSANALGIGPMGFGGKTTLLAAKACMLNRLPASYFVTVSYMCWAFRRQGVALGKHGQIEQWLY
ncbi:MAG: fumarate hydratase, partial [Verrucomicrobiae bacterium]|nr:fumarate hydratase [Verrucomicrobiae bacterium]